MIKIVCVGRIKERYLMEMIEDYQKRISKYHKLEIIEVKDVGTLESEKVLIEKYLDARDYIITLEILGKEYTSEEFALKMEKILKKELIWRCLFLNLLFHMDCFALLCWNRFIGLSK